MDGVMNLKREFSSDYADIEQWKFVVEYFEDMTTIKYMECKDKKWTVKNEMSINACCDQLLFKTVAKDFENGEVEQIRR